MVKDCRQKQFLLKRLLPMDIRFFSYLSERYILLERKNARITCIIEVIDGQRYLDVNLITLNTDIHINLSSLCAHTS